MSTNKRLGREQVLFRNTVCEEKRITKKQRMLAYFSLHFWIQVKLHHSVHMQISHNIKTFHQLFNHQNISDPLWLQDFGCSLWFSQLMLWKFGCLVVACASCIPQAIPKQLFFPAEHCIKKIELMSLASPFSYCDGCLMCEYLIYLTLACNFPNSKLNVSGRTLAVFFVNQATYL